MGIVERGNSVVISGHFSGSIFTTKQNAKIHSIRHYAIDAGAQITMRKATGSGPQYAHLITEQYTTSIMNMEDAQWVRDPYVIHSGQAITNILFK